MKKTLKKITPSNKQLQNHKYLSWLGGYLLNDNLWFFSRRAIAKAFAIGLFCAFIPVPFQMVIASIFAIIFRSNLPVAAALVWITNPITMPIIFYLAYKLGAIILGVDIISNFNFSFDYIGEVISIIWQPFLLGCLLFSSISAVLGYFAIDFIYKINIYRYLKAKKDK